MGNMIVRAILEWLERQVVHAGLRRLMNISNAMSFAMGTIAVTGGLLGLFVIDVSAFFQVVSGFDLAFGLALYAGIPISRWWFRRHSAEIESALIEDLGEQIGRLNRRVMGV